MPCSGTGSSPYARYELAETLPPRPVQLISAQRISRRSVISQKASRGKTTGLLTDVLARLEFRILFAWEDTERVSTEVITL